MFVDDNNFINYATILTDVFKPSLLRVKAQQICGETNEVKG
jgi:hypothetical protein